MGSCLEQVGGPFDFCIGADLDAFLSVLQLLPVEVDVAKMEDRGLGKKEEHSYNFIESLFCIIQS